MALSRELKVGAFVLAALSAIGLVVMLIGEERQLFERKLEFKTKFKDVEGLRGGSEVRMGGLTVGSVTNVGYSRDPKDATIYVTFQIVKNEADRIHRDSVASLAGKGLLGDKMIVLTVGTPDSPRIEPGGMVPSEQSNNLEQMVARLGNVTAHVENVVNNLEKTTNALADKDFHEDIRRGTRSLSNILESLDSGKGYGARFLHDPAEADRISKTLDSLERTSTELGESAKGINMVLARVEKGPGFAHEVVYGDGPSKAIDQFGGAADELRLTLKGIREGNGIAKGLLYGGQGTEEVGQNLNQMSADLRQIVADVRAGKGTIGALLVDPSVYEDVKLLLGNVGRNKALRALVRYSIERDEKSGKNVEVRDPTPAPASGTIAGDAHAGASAQP
jgi:phospholipid/cholesterol/gamma-HCH transport system substrate-binding protein